MKTNFTFLFGILFSAILSGQEWQQTLSTPEGGGVTDLVVRESNQNIFVTTASYNWPTGETGGVWRSNNNGDSWDLVFEAYVARTIIDGPDGNLYASVWPYPQDEGLYRSEDNGESWDLLTSVPTGNNIFAITLGISESKEYNIYIGTRIDVRASYDFGFSWQIATNGIPANSWTTDLEADYKGSLAFASDKGLFLSYDYGSNWEEAEGVDDEDTVTMVTFLRAFETGFSNRLIAGSIKANYYCSDPDNFSLLNKSYEFGLANTTARVNSLAVEEDEDIHNV